LAAARRRSSAKQGLECCRPCQCPVPPVRSRRQWPRRCRRSSLSKQTSSGAFEGSRGPHDLCMLHRVEASDSRVHPTCHSPGRVIGVPHDTKQRSPRLEGRPSKLAHVGLGQNHSPAPPQALHLGDCGSDDALLAQMWLVSTAPPEQMVNSPQRHPLLENCLSMTSSLL
jgi:hypothetical protein